MRSEGQSEGIMADRTATRVGPLSGRKRKGPLPIILAVVGLIGVVVGGVYVALLRAPAAPPRTQQIGSVRATFGTEPAVPWTGPAMATMSLQDSGGTPVADAAVTLTYDMETDSSGRRMAGMSEPGRIAARMHAPGRYVAPMTFSMAGQWVVRVAIVRAGREEGQGSFLVIVR
jgi:YtkA-like